MVKTIAKSRRETTFERKAVEDELKTAGLSARVAADVVERVESKVEVDWTTEKVRTEIDLALRQLQEDIDRAHTYYKGSTPMGAYNVGETRVMLESDNSPNVQPRSETKVECKNIE